MNRLVQAVPSGVRKRWMWLGALVGLATFTATASENVPHRPFAMWADVPARGQFVLGLVYEESEAYHVWTGGHQYHNVTVKSGGEEYGIDVNQGYLAMQCQRFSSP